MGIEILLCLAGLEQITTMNNILIIAAFCSLFVLRTSACNVGEALTCVENLEDTMEDQSDYCKMVDMGGACFGDCSDAEIDAVEPGTTAMIADIRNMFNCDKPACKGAMDCILDLMKTDTSNLEEACTSAKAALACTVGCEDAVDAQILKTMKSTKQMACDLDLSALGDLDLD